MIRTAINKGEHVGGNPVEAPPAIFIRGGLDKGKDMALDRGFRQGILGLIPAHTRPADGFSIRVNHLSPNGHRPVHPQEEVGGDHFPVRGPPAQAGVGHALFLRGQLQFREAGRIIHVALTQAVGRKVFVFVLVAKLGAILNHGIATVRVSGGSHPAPVRLLLKPGKTLRLRVVDVYGNPIPKAIIWYDCINAMNFDSMEVPAQVDFNYTTDQAGRVVLADAPDYDMKLPRAPPASRGTTKASSIQTTTNIRSSSPRR